PDGGAGYRAPAEGDPNPRTRALHALQGLLAGPRLPVQAQPPSGPTDDKDLCQRPTVNVVAGRAMRIIYCRKTMATRRPRRRRYDEGKHTLQNYSVRRGRKKDGTKGASGYPNPTGDRAQ